VGLYNVYLGDTMEHTHKPEPESQKEIYIHTPISVGITAMIGTDKRYLTVVGTDGKGNTIKVTINVSDIETANAIREAVFTFAK